MHRASPLHSTGYELGNFYMMSQLSVHSGFSRLASKLAASSSLRFGAAHALVRVRFNGLWLMGRGWRIEASRCPKYCDINHYLQIG